MTDALEHCIYASAATAPIETDALLALMEQSRRDNARRGVTGMLLYAEGSFFQVIEGPAGVIDALYERIARDARHRSVVKIVQEPIEARSFGDWSMGLSVLSRRELQQIPGLNDFFQGGHCLVELDRGRAYDLLAAFREGRWRSRIAGPLS